MNLLGLHFKLRRWFLGLFREPEETREERAMRLIGEALRSALVAWVEAELKKVEAELKKELKKLEAELKKHPLTDEEIEYLVNNLADKNE